MSDNDYKPLRIVDPMANAEKMVEVPVASDEVDLPGNDGNDSNDGIGKRKKKKDDNTYQSFLLHDNNLYEQIHHDGKNMFVVYNAVTGDIGETSGVGKIYPLPLQRNEIDTIGLPENAVNFYKQYGTANEAEADLLTEVEGFIYRYVDLDNSFRTLAACYVLLSWLYDKFYSIPYLRLLGDFGTGKSRALDVIGGVCYRPANVSGATKAAGIFRLIDRWRGTLILDESDFRYSDETVDIIRILNMGFEKNRTVLRVNTNDMSLEHFQSFCPKIIASRKKFHDEALESRCISTITKQTNRNDLPFSLGKQFFEERDLLRKKLLMYRLRNWELIDPEIFNIDVNVEPRLKQISLPFFVLFGNNQELLNDFKKFIEGFQKELVEDRAQSLPGQTVNALFELFDTSGRRTERVLSDTGVTAVTAVTPSQIADKLDLKDVKPARVGNLLKSVGLRTRVAKIDGRSSRVVEYHEERFKALQARYIPADGYDGYESYDDNVESTEPGKDTF
jgi:hypothetical protein